MEFNWKEDELKGMVGRLDDMVGELQWTAREAYKEGEIKREVVLRQIKIVSLSIDILKSIIRRETV